MAQNSTPVSTACFVWKTLKPYPKVSRKSCNFSFLGAEWWLEMKLAYNSVKKQDYFTITLKKDTHKVLGSNCTICVSTILEVDNNATVNTMGDSRKPFQLHGFTEKILWEVSEQYLVHLQYVTTLNFLPEGPWKVICVFHDIPPPVLENEIAKMDSSTQVDVATPASAEKCIQVSRDLSDTDKLSEDLSSLLRLSLYPDAKLRCGDRTVPVHRSVLAARSRKFDTMFRDLSSDTFDVTDLDDKTLDPLLEYAYSGTVRDLSDCTVVTLYEAGKKFGMDSLCRSCSDWMILHLTAENCLNFLDAANSGNDGPLEEAVASFLYDHPEVFSSPSWDRFAEEHQSFAYKLIHTYSLRSLKLR